jgi:hypothetical protein
MTMNSKERDSMRRCLLLLDYRPWTSDSVDLIASHMIVADRKPDASLPMTMLEDRKDLYKICCVAFDL